MRCLKQFSLKSSLILECASCWSYAFMFVVCFKPVAFPDKLQWSGKHGAISGNSVRAIPHLGKEGRGWTVCSEHLVIFTQLCGLTQEPSTNAEEVWNSSIFHSLKPTSLILHKVPFLLSDWSQSLRKWIWLARFYCVPEPYSAFTKHLPTNTQLVRCSFCKAVWFKHVYTRHKG